MVLGLISAGFLLSTVEQPLDTALSRTEPPISLRAAFVVEMTDGEAFREIRYDPRLAQDQWVVTVAEGQSRELDKAVQEWGNDDSPDGWLFADDLRASMGRLVEAEDTGLAWQIQFQHQISENDGPLDKWAANHLIGIAWLEPVNGYFLRIDYESYEPFSGPGGLQVDSYNHHYLIRQEPEYGFSYIWAFKVDMHGQFQGSPIDRAYRVQVTDVEFFFATPGEEARYQSQRLSQNTGDYPRLVSAN